MTSYVIESKSKIMFSARKCLLKATSMKTIRTTFASNLKKEVEVSEKNEL